MHKFSDPPTVSVHLANEDPSRNITRAEGENITLKCRADARPPVTTFGWFKNVSTLANTSICDWEGKKKEKQWWSKSKRKFSISKHRNS